MKKYLTILSLFIALFSADVFGQVVVKDPAFATFIQGKIPQIYNVANNTIDTIKLRNINLDYVDGKLNGSFRQIKSINEIVYFVRFDTLIFNDNLISELPNVQKFRSLDMINLGDNLFTKMPDFHLIPTLKHIEIEGNDLTEIETTIEQLKDSLQVLSIKTNYIKKLDHIDWESMTALQHVAVQMNYLTFDQLIKLRNLSNGDIFTLFPQRYISPTTRKYTFYKGENAMIDIGIDEGVPNTTYYLYHEDVLVDSSTTPRFQFNNISETASGQYYVIFKNTRFPNKELRTGKMTLNVHNCLLYDSLHVEKIDTIDCKDIRLIMSLANADNLSYKFRLMDQEKNLVGEYTSLDTVTIQQGIHYVNTYIEGVCVNNVVESFKIDSLNCTKDSVINFVDDVHSDSTVIIENEKVDLKEVEYLDSIVYDEKDYEIENEVVQNEVSTDPLKMVMVDKEWIDPVLTPNGDHIQDFYFIEKEGITHVYNRVGFKVADLQGPLEWEGTTDNGDLLVPGFYLLIFPDKTEKYITIQY